MTKLFLFLLFTLASQFTYAADPQHNSAVQISGRLQVWHSKCVRNGACEQPQALSDFTVVELTLNRPVTHASDGRSFVRRTVFTAGYQVDLAFFLNQTTTPQTSYVAGQAVLRNDQGRIIAQCSQYDDISSTKFFLIGACSGMLSDTELIGVTFYK